MKDTKQFLKILGGNIAARLVEQNITRKELADKIEVSESMVTRYINGTSEMNGYVLFKIAHILNCTVKDLTK